MPRAIQTGRVGAKIIGRKRQQAPVSAQEFETSSARFVKVAGEAAVAVTDTFIRKQIVENKKLQDNEDRTSALEANNKYANWNREYKQNVEANQLGENAEGSYDEYQAEAQKVKGEIYSGITPQAQSYAESGFANKFNNGSNFTLAHQTKQGIIRETAALDTSTQIAVEDAVDFSDNPATVVKSEETVRANIEAVGDKQGLDEDVIQNRVDTGVSGLYGAVFNEKLKTDPKEAKDFLVANGDKFKASTYSVLLKEADELAEEQDVYDTAIALEVQGLTPEQQQTKIDSIAKTDVEKSQKVKRVLDDRRDEKQAIKDLNTKKLYESEVDKVFQVEGVGYKPPLNFPAKEQTKLYNLARTMSKNKAAANGVGSPTKTDVLLYNNLLSKSPAEFKKVDMTDPKIVGGLSESDYKQMVRLQKKNREAYTSVQTKTTYVNNFVKAEAEEDNDRANFVREMFENELNTYPEDQRNRIETWNKIRDNMLLEVDVESKWYNPASWSDEKYWEARLDGKTIIEPDDKPDSIPDGSRWVDKMVDNSTVRGWQFTNAEGITFLYSTDGNIYRVN